MIVVGLFHSVLRRVCCCCWGLPSRPVECWGFSYYGGVCGKQCLVTLYTSFWRGICHFKPMLFFGFVTVIHLVFLCVCDVQKKRVTLLMAASLFQGASIGPLIDLAIQIEPRYVLYGGQLIVWGFVWYIQRARHLWLQLNYWRFVWINF